MDTLRSARRRLLAVGLAWTVAGAACSAPERVDAKRAAPADRRREELRDQLRGTLGERYDVPLAAATIEELARGSNFYDMLCRACHGPTGKGNGRSARMLMIQPPDLTDPSTAAFFSDRAKLQIINEGIAGSPMIGWSRMLEEQDQIAVLHFMSTLVREPQSP